MKVSENKPKIISFRIRQNDYDLLCDMAELMDVKVNELARIVLSSAVNGFRKQQQIAERTARELARSENDENS